MRVPVRSRQLSILWCRVCWNDLQRLEGRRLTHAVLRYSSECYCGNQIAAGSVLQSSDPVAAGCSMVCGGNSSEYCGGPNRLSMYALDGTIPTSTSSAGAQPTSTGAGAVAPTQSPLSCPASNATYYIAPSGARFIIECGINREYS